MSEAVVVALIGAGGTVLAAVITAIYTHNKTRKPEVPPPIHKVPPPIPDPPKQLPGTTQEAPPPDTNPKYWCLNFDEQEVLEYGLQNNMWMMQYQYPHGGETHQGHKPARISANWKAVAKIKVGDRCVAYLKRNNFFAVGEVTAPRKKFAHEDTVKRTLDEGEHRFLDGVVGYPDAAGAFYEDHTEQWSYGISSYAQRIDVKEWEYVRRGSDRSYVPINIPGLGEAVNKSHDFIQNAAFQIDESFFRRIEKELKQSQQSRSTVRAS